MPSFTVDEQGKITEASNNQIPEAYKSSKGDYFGGLISKSDYIRIMTGDLLYTFSKALSANTALNNTYSIFTIMDYISSDMPDDPFISANYFDNSSEELYPLRFRKIIKGSSFVTLYFDVEALKTVLNRTATVTGDRIIVHSNYKWTDNAHK